MYCKWDPIQFFVLNVGDGITHCAIAVSPMLYLHYKDNISRFIQLWHLTSLCSEKYYILTDEVKCAQHTYSLKNAR